MKKFTLFIMMLVACVSMTFAQTAITSPDDIQSNKTYWISNCRYYTWDYGSAMYFDRIFNDRICLGYFGQAGEGRGDFVDNPEDPDQHFAFIEHNGHLYLYSVGADNFVSMKDGGAHIMSCPESFVTVTPNTCTSQPDFPWNIKFDGTTYIGGYYARAENGYITCIDDQTSSSLSNAWKILEVGELENAEEIKERLANSMNQFDDVLIAAQDSLMYTYEAAEEFLSDINYIVEGGTPITLQATDPGAPNYIWCNEPEMSEGSMEGLIDDDEKTFFHSAWNNRVESEHWLVIELGTPIKDFMFSYQTRYDAQSDFPEAIEVQGSNDGVDFVTLKTFDQGLPQTKNTEWDSENINADEAYSYLRFKVYTQRVFWHMAKFQLRTERFISIDELYRPYLSYINDLAKAIEDAKKFIDMNEATKPEEYYAYAEQIISKIDFIKSLVSEEDNEETIALVKEAEELYAIEGVGYPGEATRATFKAIIDSAKAKPTTKAGLDLKAAMKAYIESHDITMPTAGEKYTLAFVTTKGKKLYLNTERYYGGGMLFLVPQTYFEEIGEPIPPTAAFTCVDNGDGTFDFMIDDTYLTLPEGYSESGTETALVEYQTYFNIEKLSPNDMTGNYTYEDMFGLVALSAGGTYMAPTSDGSTFYLDNLPNFTIAWTSAMVIEPWSPVAEGIDTVTVENSTKGIYDLQGRKVENPSAGIYIVNGKKVLVK